MFKSSNSRMLPLKELWVDRVLLFDTLFKVMHLSYKLGLTFAEEAVVE
jgi:hypothetical protein